MAAQRHKYDWAIKTALANADEKQSTSSLHREIEKALRDSGVPDEEIPSEPTIRRRRREITSTADAGKAQLAPYRYVTWPETFEAGLLPWEASAVFLESLDHLQRSTGRRANVRSTRWLFWVAQALPNVPRDQRMLLAGRLAGLEASGTLHTVTREIESVMAQASRTGEVAVDRLPALQFTSDSPELAEIVQSTPGAFLPDHLAHAAGLIRASNEEENDESQS